MWKRARRRGEGMLYYVLQLVIGVCREALFWGGLAGGTRLGHFWRCARVGASVRGPEVSRVPE